MYFVQGILGLARLGVTYMYKDEFHLEPATVRLHRLTTVLPSLALLKDRFSIQFYLTRMFPTCVRAVTPFHLREPVGEWALADRALQCPAASCVHVQGGAYRALCGWSLVTTAAAALAACGSGKPAGWLCITCVRRWACGPLRCWNNISSARRVAQDTIGRK